MRNPSVSLSLLAFAGALALGVLSAEATENVHNQKVVKMEIKRKGELKRVTGPAEYFTGRVTITGQFQREAPSRVSGAVVHFEAGARTAWHTHPLGQTLIVTEGVGWTQIEGGPKLEFHAGDILWCPPEHKHWHGATSATAMSHIAIQEAKDGSPVTWMEHVTDAQYLSDVARPDAK
ncbi:MAG TPA: cupin domain-containing protein [Steroidobacteraceae bacterium]|nr:cupin domain-containing protein [Steroidobacteraceae bacterium]